MINKRELRIGNLVKVINTIIEVTEIKSGGINPIWEDYQYSYTALQPIPLTEEILEKTNLRADIKKDYYEYGNFFLERARNSWYCEHIEVTSLHQLQNIYFALSGEELDVSKILKNRK